MSQEKLTDKSDKELDEEVVREMGDVAVSDALFDELLAEIDEVLEEDAEQFVEGFKQVGGQ